MENGSQPHLDRNGIGKISAGAKVFLLHECPDDAKANKRKKAATKERLPANCLHVDGSCCAHAIHLVITDSIDEKNLIGDLVAIEFTAHVPNTFNCMLVAFRAWLHRDLELHEGAPPERFLQHTRHVLKYTLPVP